MDATDDARPDPSEDLLPPGAQPAGDALISSDVGEVAGPERVSIHGIADKVKGLLRSRG